MPERKGKGNLIRVYRSQGWISPVLLVDGRMEGVWRHERKGGRLVVEIEPFTEQPGWVRHGAEQEAERVARCLGGELKFIWSLAYPKSWSSLWRVTALWFSAPRPRGAFPCCGLIHTGVGALAREIGDGEVLVEHVSYADCPYEAGYLR